MSNCKFSIEHVSKSLEEESYVLLSGKYYNTETKLDYICPNGHRHSITWQKWQQGRRCPHCFNYSMRLKIEFIRLEFEKEDYILLTTEYINSKQKLEYICPSGHSHSISWNNWKLGARCSICNAIKISGSSHPNWKGGISYEPYCDVWIDKEYKESIKDRDNYECQNPDCWGTSKRLSIHHIDYIKKNCCPENLITLCNSCNSRANKNRECHAAYYKRVMERRGLNGGMACLDNQSTKT